MTIDFTKYHGAGNDFIIVDNRSGSVNLTTAIINSMCRRHFGVGADGLIEIVKSADADFYMRYYNADGNEGTMCGNGGRCAAAFAYNKGIGNKEMMFETIDGVHEAKVLEEQPELIIQLSMNEVTDFAKKADHYFIDTGSPHYVRFQKDLEQEDFSDKARLIRHSYRPGGTNVNFAKREQKNIAVRTYERGVEDETLACGTGVTAVAVAAAREDNLEKGSYTVETKGGKLKVFIEKSQHGFKNIWLEGPATRVFNGKINL